MNKISARPDAPVRHNKDMPVYTGEGCEGCRCEPTLYVPILSKWMIDLAKCWGKYGVGKCNAMWKNQR